MSTKLVTTLALAALGLSRPALAEDATPPRQGLLLARAHLGLSWAGGADANNSDILFPGLVAAFDLGVKLRPSLFLYAEAAGQIGVGFDVTTYNLAAYSGGITYYSRDYLSVSAAVATFKIVTSDDDAGSGSNRSWDATRYGIGGTLALGGELRTQLSPRYRTGATLLLFAGQAPDVETGSPWMAYSVSIVWTNSLDLF
ncbi:MAG TPA: hypothetical protein VN914_12190 [Polyangia bacterium]|nr:hypothetical protein [Polyangia bacterium]